MADSVAGKIRIDLLANAAQFNAGLRDASRSMGDFYSEFDRLSKKFNSQKSLADRAAKERSAWADTMHGNGGVLNEYLTANDMSFKSDQALRNSLRYKSMIPWGNSMRTELSREAAETAALIGSKSKFIKNQLASAIKDMSIQAGDAAGFGGLIGTVGKFAAGHPVLTAAALTGGYMVKQAFDRDELARSIKRESLMLGQSAMDTSLLHGAGFDPEMGARFLRSMSDQAPEQLEAFKKLHLSADDLSAKPLKDALLDVAKGFSAIRNPADRASAAMHLFGRSGAEVIATLDSLQTKFDLVGDHDLIKADDVTKVKSWDNACKGAYNTISDLAYVAGRMTGLYDGTATDLFRRVENAGHVLRLDWEGLEKSQTRQAKEDYNTEHAAELEKARIAQEKLAREAERESIARQKSSEHLKALDKKIYEARYGKEASDRKDYYDELVKLGIKDKPVPQEWSQYAKENAPGQYLSQLMRIYDESHAIDKKRLADEESQRKDEALRKTLSERAMSPKQKYDEEISDATRLFGKTKSDIETLASIKRKALEEYYQAEAGLSAKQFKEEFKSTKEKFRDRLEWLDKMGADKGLGLSSKEVLAAKERAGEDYRKSLGLNDPLGDYQKKLRDLDEALKLGKDRGGITEEQFKRTRDKLRRSAVSEMISDVRDVSPVSAMQAGSSAVQNLIAQSQLHDPKVQLAKQAAEKLDAIERNTRNQATDKPVVFNF